MIRRRTARAGYTMMEMLVVVAVLLIIGGVVLPTLTGLTGNTKVKAAGDAVKTRLLEARLAAMEQGRPYQFSISQDGRQMRIGPDESVGAEVDSEGNAMPGITASELLPEDITLRIAANTAGTSSTDSAGNRVAVTFQPDGTCNDESSELEILEGGFPGLVVRVRGLTGAVTTGAPTRGTGAN